jgi:Peptidase family M13
MRLRRATTSLGYLRSARLFHRAIAIITMRQIFFVALILLSLCRSDLAVQWACESDRPENLRVHAKTDPHSPGRYRVNGLVVNMREFAEVFSCPVTAPLVKKDVCRVW